MNKLYRFSISYYKDDCKDFLSHEIIYESNEREAIRKFQMLFPTGDFIGMIKQGLDEFDHAKIKANETNISFSLRADKTNAGSATHNHLQRYVED